MPVPCAAVHGSSAHPIDHIYEIHTFIRSSMITTHSGCWKGGNEQSLLYFGQKYDGVGERCECELMSGVRVGNRLIGTQSPVTVGWENIRRVDGGPFKQWFFTWFQPAVLFGLIVFWYYAPNSIAKASTAVGIGVGFKILLLGLELVNPRYNSWRLTWKELATDLFYVGLGYTLLRLVDGYLGDGPMIEAIRGYWHLKSSHGSRACRCWCRHS